MIRFIISFLIFTALVAIPAFFARQTAYAGWVGTWFWKMFVFFAVITGMVCLSVLTAQKKDSKTGVQVFLAATVIKLLACMVFALIYALNKPVNASGFMVAFFYLYFVFTAFEIYSLLTNLRDQNKK